MTKIMPQNFPPIAPPAIASYTYTDIADGLGYIKFYGYTTEVSGGSLVYNLGTNEIYSSEISTRRTGSGTTTMTFNSSPFNLPRTCEGTAFLSFGVAGENSATISGGAIIQKYDGTTATNLASPVMSDTFKSTTKVPEHTFLLPFDLTQTRILKGEQLRVLFYFWQAGNNDVEVGHDPVGRDGLQISGGIGTTKFTLYMPFRTEIN